MISCSKIVLIGLLCVIFIVVPLTGKPFTKYGRGCADIGCPSSETCVMVADACNLGQRENRQCGSYPTCKRRSTSGSTNTISTRNFSQRNSTRNTGRSGIVPPRPTPSRTYY